MSSCEYLKNEGLKEKKELRERKNDLKNIKTKKYNIKEEKIIVGKYSDVPDYLKDNEFIKEGYLINCHSLKLVLRSLFVCSNETINVWSHLLGCIISILLIIFIATFIRTSFIKELTQLEYEDLQMKINETIIPWSWELRKHKLNENETINENVGQIIDNILSNSHELVTNFGTKFTSVAIIGNFIENTKNLINFLVIILN